MKETWRITSDGNIIRKKRIQYPNGDVYDGDILNGKWNGEGTFTSSSDRKYVGTFKDGYFHGHGIYEYSDGKGQCKYNGSFHYGKRCGLGIFLDSSGNEWNGTWVDDSFTGEGQVNMTNGDRLIGEFKNNKLECTSSIIEYHNGDRYEGPCHAGKMDGSVVGKYSFHGRSKAYYEGLFFRGLKHGKGTFCYEDGSIYKGDFYEDNITGYGIIEYAIFRSPLKSYRGYWENGHYQGDGELLYHDAVHVIRSYTGSFIRGNFDGFGKLLYRDGGFYEGDFQVGKRHGSHGTRLWSSGNTFVGSWSDDGMKNGMYTDPSKCSYYAGSFASGQKNGRGREIWNLTGKQKKSKDPLLAWLYKCDGLYLYEGEYRNGTFDGHGKLFAPCGRKYEGCWRMGRPSGFGQAILLSKGERSLYRPYKYVGEWSEGKRHGQGMLFYHDGTKKSGLFVFGQLKLT